MVEGSGHHTPEPKMVLNKKIKISNTEFDVQTERRFVILWPTKDQNKSVGGFWQILWKFDIFESWMATFFYVGCLTRH